MHFMTEGKQEMGHRPFFKCSLSFSEQPIGRHFPLRHVLWGVGCVLYHHLEALLAYLETMSDCMVIQWRKCLSTGAWHSREDDKYTRWSFSHRLIFMSCALSLGEIGALDTSPFLYWEGQCLLRARSLHHLDPAGCPSPSQSKVGWAKKKKEKKRDGWCAALAAFISKMERLMSVCFDALSLLPFPVLQHECWLNIQFS